MPVSRDTAVALYQQIASTLQEEINAGQFAKNGKLPSEQQLISRFGVSRVTVRQALGQLFKDGRIIRKQGKGTFVAGPTLRHELHSMRGFYDSLVQQGVEPQTTLLEFGPVAAKDAPVAMSSELAGENPSPCFYLRRLYSVGGAPMAVVCAYLPADAAQISWQQANDHPVYGILENLLGLTIVQADVRIRVQPAGDQIGQLLGLDARALLLVMERASADGQGTIKEHTTLYIRPESYEFVFSAFGPIPLSSSIRHTE